MSVAELDAQLRGYAPIGLWLRDYFHARTDVDPRSTITAPCEAHFDEGLGEVNVWSGIVDAMPFAIRSMQSAGGGWGLEILFPVRRNGADAYREALAEIALHLPVCRSTHVDPVVELGKSAPHWLVIGPDAGPYISRIEIDSSEEAARRRAARWADDTGAAFEVRQVL
jgi:hypothetical protein